MVHFLFSNKTDAVVVEVFLSKHLQIVEVKNFLIF